MKGKGFFFFLWMMVFLACGNTKEEISTKKRRIPDDFLKGMDISFVPEIENRGGVYRKNGQERDFFDILDEAGINTVRIRLWHSHPGGESSLEKAVALARRAKQRGMKILLDFHYSDTWADPGNQSKPAAWSHLEYEELKKAIKQYTYEAISLCMKEGVYPDFVQVGNEISSGFLWDIGRIGGVYDTNWNRFAELLKNAIEGVREADKSLRIKIILHHHAGSDYGSMDWFFGHITLYGVPYDIIGVSYYPFFSHASLASLKHTLLAIASRYHKPLFVLETAYPWTTDYADNLHNVFGEKDFLLSDYPATPEGQKKYLYDFLWEMYLTGCIGVIYWGGEWISLPGYGSMWENMALFDFEGDALPALFTRW
ncbi:glycoside hydrolase family 53 protein [Thermospira aquatica]|uniref:Arabinogalactan endo-beta-1,4-galactanase n=1 Tax=Thermospira aquatica TaxID=2828656 RepID=A0AAX3BEA8_9SPIR|nr:glycosyl hydrolase 53 family protein [Thermospira aquatica]URA10672.1 glycosyl hydrolase 53 family protein [Thermospira aquatica]